MKIQVSLQHRQPRKGWWGQSKTGRGCPSLVGGRPAKSVAGNGRVGSNPTPRATLSQRNNTDSILGFTDLGVLFGCETGGICTKDEWGCRRHLVFSISCPDCARIQKSVSL